MSGVADTRTNQEITALQVKVKQAEADIAAIIAAPGGAPTNATYITQTPNAALSAEQALSALATGILKSTTATGVVSIAGAGTDYSAPGHTHSLADITDDGTMAAQNANAVAITGGSVTGITDLAVADGGTGASALGDAGVLIGNGTGAVQVTSAGNAGQVLTSNGAGVDPTFQAAAAGYTDEQAQDAVGVMVDGSLTYVDATPLLQRAALTGDVTASAGSNTTAIAADVVTVAKMHAAATDVFFGRDTAAAGPGEEITVAAAKTLLALTGTNSGDQTISLTGDVTGSGTGSFAATIANDAVTNAKLANMANATIKGRTTAGTGDPEDMTAAQTRAILNVADGANAYVHPNHSGDVTSVADGAQTLATVNSNVGAFTNASVTVNGKGLVTAAASGTAPVTSVSGTSPIASSGGVTPAISLNDTAVTPGAYTHASVTVDQKGRLTAASSGTTPPSATDIQIFTANGTWTKPTGAKVAHVVLISGGGGGGSGRRGLTATVRCGGGGGGGGGMVSHRINASLLGATEAVVVGAGGAGGAAQTVDSTNGVIGTIGGTSSFGTWLSLPGGGGGGGGTVNSGTAGFAERTATEFGVLASGAGNGAAASGTGLVGVASGPAAGQATPRGGGSGGGLTGANAQSNGGAGAGQSNIFETVAGGAAGVAPGGAGGAGGARLANYPMAGGGGGGGSSRTTGGTGGSGGAGGIYGSGGGGGGASLNANNSGAGGAGAAGILIVTTYF